MYDRGDTGCGFPPLSALFLYVLSVCEEGRGYFPEEPFPLLFVLVVVEVILNSRPI